MKDRLAQFLRAEQLSPARLAELLQVQASGISHILAGRNKPGYDFLSKLLHAFPKVNAQWLMTGRGRMYLPEPEAAPAEAAFTAPGFTPPSPGPTLSRETIDTEPIPSLPFPQLPNPDPNKRISRIVILYSDRSFCEYFPQND